MLNILSTKAGPGIKKPRNYPGFVAKGGIEPPTFGL